MSETAIVAPKPKKIDDLIFRYSVLKAAVDAADDVKKKAQADADVVKAEVVALVKSFGAATTEKSKKLTGARNSATITIGTITTIVDAAVELFREYLQKLARPGLVDLFFTETTTYQLVGAPSAVVKTLDVPEKTRLKLITLLALCFDTKNKEPSLKVEVAETTTAA